MCLICCLSDSCSGLNITWIVYRNTIEVSSFGRYMVVGLAWHLFWYRQLCWPMRCQDICLSATACQDVPQVALSISRVPYSDGFGLAFVLV